VHNGKFSIILGLRKGYLIFFLSSVLLKQIIKVT
jgi:hypothetical protein